MQVEIFGYAKAPAHTDANGFYTPERWVEVAHFLADWPEDEPIQAGDAFRLCTEKEPDSAHRIDRVSFRHSGKLETSDWDGRKWMKGGANG